MPALTFEARVTGGRVKRVPSGVLLESETSQLVRVGPNKPTDETSSLILIFTEVVEAAAALLGWTPPPKCKMVTGEQIAAEARLGIIGNEPRLLLDEGVAEEVVAEVFGGPIIDHDPGDEGGHDDVLRSAARQLVAPLRA